MRSWFQFLQTLFFFTFILGAGQWACVRMFCNLIGSEASYYPLLGLAFSFNAFLSTVVCGKHWTDEDDEHGTRP